LRCVRSRTPSASSYRRDLHIREITTTLQSPWAQGALLSLCGGLLSSVLLVVFSPVVSSTPSSLYPSADFALFPLQNPGIVSIPAGFFLGWLGSVLSRPQSPESYEDFEVRTLVGADQE
ncbi:hypothetical protein ACFVYM_41305, partial [Streptomyces sp. NPDC058298]